MSHCDHCKIDHPKVSKGRDCPIARGTAVCHKCGNSPDWYSGFFIEMECHGNNYYCDMCIGYLHVRPIERPCKAEPPHCCNCNLRDVVLEDDPDSDRKYCAMCIDWRVRKI